MRRLWAAATRSHSLLHAAARHRGQLLAGLDLSDDRLHGLATEVVVAPAAVVTHASPAHRPHGHDHRTGSSGGRRPGPRWPPRPALRTQDRLRAAHSRMPPASATVNHAAEARSSAARIMIPTWTPTRPKTRHLCDRTHVCTPRSHEGARARPCFGECSHARNEAARAWVGSPDDDLTATEPTNASRSGGWKSEATKRAPKMIFISPQIVHKKFANDRC